MSLVEEVVVGPRSLDPFEPFVGAAEMERVRALADQLASKLGDTDVWNVNSTGRGGGVAELLRSVVAYARGAGIDCRWAVISGDEEFFRITKRLHNAAHGAAGDGTPLGPTERAKYEQICNKNAAELTAIVQPDDIVILHDPQTAGLVHPLVARGARVVWRCHIGADEANAETALAWEMLAPLVREAEVYVFSREAYIPAALDRARCTVIPPTIDPFSPKNQLLDDATVAAILGHVGLVHGGGPTGGSPRFVREDGTQGRVDRRADVLRLGPLPDWSVPLIVQVSRWDRLKDHIGVLRGFARLIERGLTEAELVLAGPSVTAVADDPEGAEVFDEVIAAWRALPHGERQRVHLVNLPMADIDENAAIVNALQRHATIVVQKSLAEGFGLTVAEAMWKERPVVASRVGGIQDQIEDGVSGVLLADPTDLDAFADALAHLLTTPDAARRIGRAARERVRDEFLSMTSLLEYEALISRLL